VGRRGELQIFNWERKVRGEQPYCAGGLLPQLSPCCAPSSHSGSHWRGGRWPGRAREHGQPPSPVWRLRGAHRHGRAAPIPGWGRRTPGWALVLQPGGGGWQRAAEVGTRRCGVCGCAHVCVTPCRGAGGMACAWVSLRAGYEGAGVPAGLSPHPAPRSVHAVGGHRACRAAAEAAGSESPELLPKRRCPSAAKTKPCKPWPHQPPFLWLFSVSWQLCSITTSLPPPWTRAACAGRVGPWLHTGRPVAGSPSAVMQTFP